MSDAGGRGHPLRGLRIAVTRAPGQANGLVSALRELGAEAILCPAIAIAPPDSFVALDAAIERLHEYGWLIFTSANGVSAFVARLGDLGLPVSRPARARIGAIGPATAEALARAGLVADFVPSSYVAEAIVEQVGDVAGRRILLPRADIAREALAEGLRARGALVEEVTAYRTVPGAGARVLAPLLSAGAVDALTFTSSSTVRYLVEGLAAAGAETALRADRRPAIFCIGPITAATALERGLIVDAVAEEYTTEGLVRALAKWFDDKPGDHHHD